jgi:photosystem II stability/assembly factor-like uncharacterized protein
MHLIKFNINYSTFEILKLITILVCSLTFLFAPSTSFAGWNQLSSPTSQNLNGVWFADATTGVCVGDSGTVELTEKIQTHPFGVRFFSEIENI